MDKINYFKWNLSLRKSLVLYMLFFVLLALLLSTVTFSICNSAVNKITNSYPPSGEKYYLTARQRRVYRNYARITSQKRITDYCTARTLSYYRDTNLLRIMYRCRSTIVLQKSFKKAALTTAYCIRKNVRYRNCDGCAPG